MRRLTPADADCAIAQSAAVVGDWWTLLLVRDIVGGRNRFDDLQAQLGVSRKVLAERLRRLVEDGVLERRRYSSRPPRFEYHLTERGQGLVPVLVALQDWGTRHLLGDGTLSASSGPDSAESRRVRGLEGSRVPPLGLLAADGRAIDPLGGSDWTVLYCFPGAAPPGAAQPPGWNAIPGALGCTLESLTFRDRLGEFAARSARVYGVSTQRPDELAAFAAHAGLTFPLLSDVDLSLTAALRLPTFRAGGVERLKRLTVLADRERTVRGVLYPVTDPAGSVGDALELIDACRRGPAGPS